MYCLSYILNIQSELNVCKGHQLFIGFSFYPLNSCQRSRVIRQIKKRKKQKRKHVVYLVNIWEIPREGNSNYRGGLSNQLKYHLQLKVCVGGWGMASHRKLLGKAWQTRVRLLSSFKLVLFSLIRFSSDLESTLSS